TFPVSCISLLNKPPTFSVSCSYGTFIGFLSVFNDFWYFCINLSFFCFFLFVFWLSRSFSCFFYFVFFFFCFFFFFFFFVFLFFLILFYFFIYIFFFIIYFKYIESSVNKTIKKKKTN